MATWRPCWPFYQKSEIMEKRRKLEIVNASRVKCDIIKHFAAFVT